MGPAIEESTQKSSDGPPGSRTPIIGVRYRCRAIGPAARTKNERLREVRPGIEPGPPPYHGGVRPQHLRTKCTCARTSRVVPGGVEPPLSGCEPDVVPLDHGTGRAE